MPKDRLCLIATNSRSFTYLNLTQIPIHSAMETTAAKFKMMKIIH